MDIFKEACKNNVRVQTSKGLLNAIQLFTLDEDELETIETLLEAEYKESGKKTSRRKKTTKDKAIKLKLSLVTDILDTKIEDSRAKISEQERRENNAKIDRRLAEIDDEEFGKLTKEELLARRQ